MDAPARAVVGPLDGRFRFDNFVVGAGNRLAVAAATAIADRPGAVYNPLFVYSGSGLGKTHLLGALGHALRNGSPARDVAFLTLDEFVDQLHSAVSQGTTEEFKRRYASVDALLLDDVQFLTGQRETQAEMLRLFNALQSAGKQIVMTSDRPPSEITDVDERLLNRVAGGLIVDIAPPDFETRAAILRAACAERGVNFRSSVLDELARSEAPNVRELQGALNRLLAFQSLGDAELTAADVGRALGGRGTTPRRVTPIRASSAVRPTPIAPARIVTPPPAAEFSAFLQDVAQAVSLHVEGWKLRIAEAVSEWGGQGFSVAVLERALQLSRAPDVDGLLSTYASAANHLLELEKEASALDSTLADHPAFRDPARVDLAEAEVDRAIRALEPLAVPRPELTRARFTMRAGDELAARAADAVAAEPGTRYNPLVLHGPASSGKTHLAHAVANALVAADPTRRVAVVRGDEFVEQLIAALQEGKVERWRARYRVLDALAIDDVDLVAGTERAQEELFHLFNALHSLGRQLVFTSTAAPSQLLALDERIRSRLEGGLVAELAPPPVRHTPMRATPVRGGTPVRGVRATGVIQNVPSGATGAVSVDPFFLDREKVVWEWPDVGARLVEELR